MSGPQIRFCLFSFRPIASKQLNSLLTIHTLSWLGGAVVTHPLWVQEVPGSIPCPGKRFYVSFSVLLLLCFYFLSINTLFVTKCCQSFCNVNLFSILTILQDTRLIISYKDTYLASLNRIDLFGLNFMTLIIALCDMACKHVTPWYLVVSISLSFKTYYSVFTCTSYW